jgi:hypothetical protein
VPKNNYKHLNLISKWHFLIYLSYAKFDQEGRSNYGIAVAPKISELTTSFRSISPIDYTNKTNDLGCLVWKSGYHNRKRNRNTAKRPVNIRLMIRWHLI